MSGDNYKKGGGGAGREKKPEALLQKKKNRNYLSFFSLLNSHTSLKIKRIIFQWNKYIRVFSSTDFSIIIFVREAAHPERQAALSPWDYLSPPMLVLSLCSLLNSTYPRRFGQKHTKQPHKRTDNNNKTHRNPRPGSVPPAAHRQAGGRRTDAQGQGARQVTEVLPWSGPWPCS